MFMITSVTLILALMLAYTAYEAMRPEMRKAKAPARRIRNKK